MKLLSKFIIDNISEVGYLYLKPDFETQDKGKMGLNENIPYITKRNFDDLVSYYSRRNAFEIKEDTILRHNDKEIFLPKGYFAISSGSTFLGLVDPDTFERLFRSETLHFDSVQEIANANLTFEDRFFEAYKLGGFDGMKKFCEFCKLNEYHLGKIQNFIDSKSNEEDLFELFRNCSVYLENRRNYQKIEEKLSMKTFLQIYNIIMDAAKDKDEYGHCNLIEKFMHVSSYSEEEISLLLKSLKNGYLNKENIESVLELLNKSNNSFNEKEMRKKYFDYLEYCIKNNVSDKKMKLGKLVIESTKDIQLAKRIDDNINKSILVQASNLVCYAGYGIETLRENMVLDSLLRNIYSNKLNKLNYAAIENIYQKSLRALENNRLPNEKFYVDYIVGLYADTEIAKTNETLDELLKHGNCKEIDINASTIIQLLDYSSVAYKDTNDFVQLFCKKSGEGIKKSNISGIKNSNGKIYVDSNKYGISIYIKEPGILGKYTRYQLDKSKLDKLKTNKIYIDCFYKEENQRSIDKYI